jgi:hypothetical protein
MGWALFKRLCFPLRLTMPMWFITASCGRYIVDVAYISWGVGDSIAGVSCAARRW